MWKDSWRCNVAFGCDLRMSWPAKTAFNFLSLPRELYRCFTFAKQVPSSVVGAVQWSGSGSEPGPSLRDGLGPLMSRRRSSDVWLLA